ncbi:hypothetical protein LAV79_05315 [Peribacillus butanolivorans]|uniref:hypothetical protein n=1 Tax=Peribacillus butanolivorans TaxID=421767 RepID=UPI0030C94504
MAPRIDRTLIEKTGNFTVTTNGYLYLTTVVDAGVVIDLYFMNGTTGIYSQAVGDGTRIIIPPNATSIKVGAHSATSWKLLMQKTIPNKNLSELNMYRDQTGNLFISGDDDVLFRGQDTNLSTLDITGLRLSVQTLSELFMKALWSGTASDAAKYIKMKDAVLAQYPKM